MGNGVTKAPRGTVALSNRGEAPFIYADSFGDELQLNGAMISVHTSDGPRAIPAVVAVVASGPPVAIEAAGAIGMANWLAAWTARNDPEASAGVEAAREVVAAFGDFTAHAVEEGQASVFTIDGDRWSRLERAVGALDVHLEVVLDA